MSEQATDAKYDIHQQIMDGAECWIGLEHDEQFDKGNITGLQMTVACALAYIAHREDISSRSKWHPINPADTSTLPSEDDADDAGMVWLIRDNNDGASATAMAYFSDVVREKPDEILEFGFTHWAPRVKQVPPVWWDATLAEKESET